MPEYKRNMHEMHARFFLARDSAAAADHSNGKEPPSRPPTMTTGTPPTTKATTHDHSQSCRHSCAAAFPETFGQAFGEMGREAPQRPSDTWLDVEAAAGQRPPEMPNGLRTPGWTLKQQLGSGLLGCP